MKDHSIKHMTGYAKRKLVKNLETVQKAYTEERKTAETGQSIIWKLVDHGYSIMSALRPLITTDCLRPNTTTAYQGSLPCVWRGSLTSLDAVSVILEHHE